MRKYFYVIVVLLLAMSMSSCTQDQTEQTQTEENYLIGIWLCTESPEQYKDSYYTFKEDGKVIRDYDPTTSASATYTYNASAKTITTTLADAQQTYQVVSLSSSSMELMGGGFDAGSWKFQKAQTVSFPELKVDYQEISIKVGETKKLGLSGSGIWLFPKGYTKEEGYFTNTLGDYILDVDNETISVTGKYVGKCKLVVRSKNGSAEIDITVEPKNPFWEHGFIIDKVKALTIVNVVVELGMEYSSYSNDSGNKYTFENVSDKINSLVFRNDNGNISIQFNIPSSQMENLEKALQEYGNGSDISDHYYPSFTKVLDYQTSFENWRLMEWCKEDVIQLNVVQSGR